jgi:beta-1,4-galactosyltransferase 1/beta-1,4-galactosyltransferase 2
MLTVICLINTSRFFYQSLDYKNSYEILFDLLRICLKESYISFSFSKISPLGHQFNKGRLFNKAINYLENESLNITCIILHDVDLIPEDDGNYYSCESARPKHTTSRVRQLNSTKGYTRYYEFLIGGVLMLTIDMYKTLNGFSNLYWGWGGEDDDLALRLIQQRMCVVRPNYDLAIYVGLPHQRGQRNNARFGLLTWTTLRFLKDGYKQIEPLAKIVDIIQTSMVTHLKLDVDADGAYIKSPSNEKSSSSLKGAPGTSVRKKFIK